MDHATIIYTLKTFYPNGDLIDSLEYGNPTGGQDAKDLQEDIKSIEDMSEDGERWELFVQSLAGAHILVDEKTMHADD